MLKNTVTRTHWTIAWMAFAGLMLTVATPFSAQAAEIKLLASVALRILLPELLPQFENATGHKVTVGYGTLGAVTERLAKGEATDVAMLTSAQIDRLQTEGKLLAGIRVEIARMGIAAFVKKGASRPDLSSTEALKQTLRAATSIAMGDPAGGGASGVYLAGLMERLGLAVDIKGKTRLMPSGTEVVEAVAKGDVEIGIGVASDAAIMPGLDSIALPMDVQNYIIFWAGLSAGSAQPDAAKALIAFLTSPTARQAFVKGGFEVR